MSILKEIKYAINSTVGTNIFKPLDQIIKPKSIKLTASDFDARTPPYISSPEFIGKLKFKCCANGDINICIIGNAGSTAKIFKNNTVITDIELSYYNQYAGNYFEIELVRIDNGDLIEVDAEGCYIEIRATEICEFESFEKI